MATASSGDELTDDGSCGTSLLLARATSASAGSSSSSSGSDSDSDSDGDDSSSSSSSSSSGDGSGGGGGGGDVVVSRDEVGSAMSAASAARQRAQAGSAAAQFDLGKRYIDGDGVVSDDAEAVRWFRRAATQGHVGAQHGLALCLAEGRGAPRNTSDAVQWLRRAANKGHAPSAAELVKREQHLSGFLNSNVVVMAGRTARPVAELQQAALDSLAGCTLELEVRRDGGWVSLRGAMATAAAESPGREVHRGKLLLSLPRPCGEPDRLWSTVVTDRRIRRYHVTASAPTTTTREGSPLSETERAAIEWRRSSSRIPDLRGEAWCETWDSLGRSLGRDPANLAAAYAQHTALNPELCEDCLGRRPSYGLPDDGGRARWCRRCAIAVRSRHPTLVNVRNPSRQLQRASGTGSGLIPPDRSSSVRSSSRVTQSDQVKKRLSTAQIDHLRAVSKATRRVRFGPSTREGGGKRRRNEGCSVCLRETISKPLTLRCGHEFHLSCIVKWLAQRPKCPMCLATISFNSEATAATSATSGGGSATTTTPDGQAGRTSAEAASHAVSFVAASVEIYSASNDRWVVADSVRPASPKPVDREQGRGGAGRVTVEYVFGGERRKKTVRANDRSLLRPRRAAVPPTSE